VAGALAAFRPPSAAWRSAIMHFAAGVVFAVVAVELLPDITHEHAVGITAAGFALGTAVMLGLRSLTRRAEGRESAEESAKNSVPTAFLAATGVDIVVDGLMLGVGFAAGAKEGMLLTVALTLELASLGLATAATLGQSGLARGKTIAICGGLALLFVGGAVGGGVPLQNISGHWLAGVLAFGSAALLFLVTEELLVEAHEVPESPWLTSTFFLGFLLFLLLEMLQ
jgi:ZIP family zinc transporter